MADGSGWWDEGAPPDGRREGEDYRGIRLPGTIVHGKDARAAGETEQRLHLLPAWRETRVYSERGQVALAWGLFEEEDWSI